MDDQRHARVERLRWHCRRALLELDIVFQRFWRETGGDLDDASLDVLERLLALEDHDLWQVVSGQRPAADPQIEQIVNRINASATEEY